MHEGSIVDSLLRRAMEHAPVDAEVRRIRVRVGRLTGVSPDALRFYFEALRGESVGEQCDLVVDQPPLRGRCEACHHEQEFDEWEWECPACKSGPLFFRNGSELELEAIEVEADGDYSDRREDPRQERSVGRRQPATV
jgi:hydrogenase nickel incorporation protein HypA/HybF